MDKFKVLGICEPVLRAIEEQGFEEPSEIQERTIPLINEGKDVIGMSATGSGKTLAFGSGIIQNAEKKAGIQALILAPTRELAEQVAKNLKVFSKFKKLFVSVIYGGVSITPQMDHLRRAEIVVGTPGRILDHIERKTIDLRGVKTLVLDEADTMLDMGFIDDVERIMKQCPKERQTLLFSATMTREILGLTKRYMKSPTKINAVAQVDPSKLQQQYYNVQNNQKFSLLVHLVNQEREGLVMVFCNTRRSTDFVADNLKFNNISALAIHGGFSQSKRSRVMDLFHGKKVGVIVCTDVAARGLHIEGVSHVYNYDVPKDPKQYVHRIGRTARAGNEGMAITLLSQMDHEAFGRLLQDYRDMKIQEIELPQLERVKIKRADDKRSGGRGGPGGFGRGGGRSGPRGSGGRSGGSRRGGSSSSRGGGLGFRGTGRAASSNRSRYGRR